MEKTPAKIDAQANAVTNSEVERERREWEGRQRKEHRDFVRQFSFHTSATFMDYLHGDVKPEEAPIACLYEYMRESRVLREVASRRDELKLKGLDGFNHDERTAWKQLSPAERAEKSALRAVEELQTHPRFIMEIMSFLECESFPKKDWQELGPAERQPILRLYEIEKNPPLRLPDVWSLNAVLKAPSWSHRLRALLEEATPVIECVPPGKKAKPVKRVLPLLQVGNSNYWAVLHLDFSESPTRVGERFRTLLEQPEFKALFDQHKKPKLATAADKALDRLKDLAAWRLYREQDNDWEAANDFANKHRKQRRPFRDAKPKGGIPAHETDLFGEEADPLKAQAGAWEHLVVVIPTEFKPPGPEMLATFAELEKLASED